MNHKHAAEGPQTAHAAADEAAPAAAAAAGGGGGGSDGVRGIWGAKACTETAQQLSASRSDAAPARAAAAVVAAGTSLPGKRKKAKRVECVVCLDAKAEVMLLPCKHVILCWGCSQLLQAASKPCPICCTPVHQHIAAAATAAAVAGAARPATAAAAAVAAAARPATAAAAAVAAAARPATAAAAAVAAAARPATAAAAAGTSEATAGTPGGTAAETHAAASIEGSAAAMPLGVGRTAAAGSVYEEHAVTCGSSSGGACVVNVNSSSSREAEGNEGGGLGGAGRSGTASPAVEAEEQWGGSIPQPSAFLLQSLKPRQENPCSSTQFLEQGVLPLVGFSASIAESHLMDSSSTSSRSTNSSTNTAAASPWDEPCGSGDRSGNALPSPCNSQQSCGYGLLLPPALVHGPCVVGGASTLGVGDGAPVSLAHIARGVPAAEEQGSFFAEGQQDGSKSASASNAGFMMCSKQQRQEEKQHQQQQLACREFVTEAACLVEEARGDVMSVLEKAQGEVMSVLDNTMGRLKELCLRYRVPASDVLP